MDEVDFGPDIITIADDDGVEYELEVLSRFECDGSEYLALTPADAKEFEEMEVNLLKVVEEDGEEVFVTIQDDDELEKVYAKLEELMFEDEDEAE